MAYETGAGSLVSLTFDDGLPCQLEHALPLLHTFHTPATFFLIGADESEYGPLAKAAWREARAEGHEIGSHTVTHRKPFSLNVGECVYEAQESKRYLEATIGGPVSTFCYPFTDAPAGLQGAVQGAGYMAARGGRGAREDKFLQPGDGANLFNVPCIHVGPSTIGDADAWICNAVRRGAWLTLMLHGVGDPAAWDNIAAVQFFGLLQKLHNARSAGLQVVTFARGAELYRKGRLL